MEHNFKFTSQELDNNVNFCTYTYTAKSGVKFCAHKWKVKSWNRDKKRFSWFGLFPKYTITVTCKECGIEITHDNLSWKKFSDLLLELYKED